MTKNAQKTITTLADLEHDPQNANKGTERGVYLVETSLERYGAGRSILVDKHGRIIAGNKTVDGWASLGNEEVEVVKSDGKKLIVVQRDDLDLETDKAAKELAIADNRASEVGLAWEPVVLAELAEEIDLGAFFYEDEIGRILEAAGNELLADFEPVGEDEQGRLDEKAKVTCPECGHCFAPS